MLHRILRRMTIAIRDAKIHRRSAKASAAQRASGFDLEVIRLAVRLTEHMTSANTIHEYFIITFHLFRRVRR
jgi:hypothetical protein